MDEIVVAIEGLGDVLLGVGVAHIIGMSCLILAMCLKS